MSIITDPNSHEREEDLKEYGTEQLNGFEGERIMAMAFREKRLGCAILVDSNVYVMEELPEGKPFQLAGLLFEQFSPTKVLLPSKCDIDLLNKFRMEGKNDEEPSSIENVREVRPMSDYSLNGALIKMRHNGILMSEELTKRYPLSIGCIGALLNKIRSINNAKYIEKIEWFSM
jgi:hypothetical protein